MEENNKKDERRQDRGEELLEGEEFGPEAFEDEADEAEDRMQAVTADGANNPEPATRKTAILPWILFAASVVAIGVLLVTGNTGNKGMNDAAAKVNGEKVTKDELYQIMYKQGGEAALDNLITERLIQQEANKQKIAVTDQDVETELADIKARFPNEQQFNDILAQNNLTLEKLKEELRTQVKVTKLFEGKMDLTDTKVKEYFEKNQNRYGKPEQIELSHILVEKKETADKILSDLKGGADFATVAKAQSTDPGSKDAGGSLGLYSKGQGFDPVFEEAAFKLGKGELSGVVETSFGYHIIKVTDKKEAVLPNFDQTQTKVRKDMVMEEMNNKMGEWVEGLKSNAKIEKM